MIRVTKLLYDTECYSDSLLHSEEAMGLGQGTRKDAAPAVVWNTTRTCNLNCIDCYMDSDGDHYHGELTTSEAKKMIDDLAEFRVPALLLSGGEPLIRPDIFELAEYVAAKGIRLTLSTNGTLLTGEAVQRIKDIGVEYVEISLDGLGEINDFFRGKGGAFQAAVEGIQNCAAAGQRVGLCFTINRHNFEELDNIFDFIEKEKIDRVCFYHLVHSARRIKLFEDDLTPAESRRAMEIILHRTKSFNERGLKKEIVTAGNHCDGAYLYLHALKENTQRAEIIWSFLSTYGGNHSGIGFAQIDPFGNVHPDQFTQHITFGNVRERKFGEIWTDRNHPILVGLRNRQRLLKGRCANCQFLNLCNGNFRVRAEALTGDFWESDPACYLTDEEISTDDSTKGVL